MDCVIFACRHNAGRSQMAAVFFNALADPSKARALSAGTQPAERIHPEVQAVMAEAGFDLTNVTPRKLTAEIAAGARWLVTMGCGEECPRVPDVAVQDWPIEDPKGKTCEQVRTIRDEVRARVEEFLRGRGWQLTAPCSSR